ncbi:MAG TPA: FAD-dependent monooxygenase [Actinoplanes sp.]|nr:FAD-dependent monooxygenase [Actinoplanes sp.]
MTVLVVGAGPTGLALACGLLQGGADVRIVDAAAGPATTSRALGLQPRGIEVMDRLGALGELPDRGVTVREVVINVDGTELTRLRVGGVTKLVTRPGVMMSQAEVEGQFRRRLAELGGAVEWNHEVTDLRHDGWIVGCDGAHSRVRKLAGVGFPGVPLIERFLVADVHADLPLDRHAVSTWLRGDRMFALFPLPGTDLWRILVPEPEGAGADDRHALLLRLLTEHTGLAASLVTGIVWTSSFRIHRRLADTYRVGRVLLAGDAAHIHSPFGGQGMNTGLGDAENLAWKLALVATGRADERLLDTYQAERRPIATEVLGHTSSMTRVMLGRTVLERVVRDHVVVPLMNRGFVQRLIAEGSSQLRVSYRRGPLGSARPLVGRGPRGGDRMPGLPLADLRGRWSVLTADRAEVRAAESRLGADAVRTLPPIPGAKAFLVRPDGHVACRGDAAEITRWLTAAGIGARVSVPVPA